MPSAKDAPLGDLSLEVHVNKALTTEVMTLCLPLGFSINSTPQFPNSS
jgi:hypothetical protein